MAEAGSPGLGPIPMLNFTNQVNNYFESKQKIFSSFGNIENLLGKSLSQFLQNT